MANVFLHVGLPRTGTTVLQQWVFPKLTGVHFVGKHATNGVLPTGKFKPYEYVAKLAEAHLRGDELAMEKLARVFTSFIRGWKIALLNHKPADAEQFCRLWSACMRRVGSILSDLPLLYSEECMIESLSGVLANISRSDSIFLEELHRMGFLRGARVSLVLREPSSFLIASYYKAMELKRPSDGPMSFEEYLTRQARILDRKPSASRIFLAMHRSFSAYLLAMKPSARIVQHAELVQSDNVVDTLLGEKIGDAPFRFKDLPRENASWRDDGVNRWLLTAPGVPAGIDIEQYRETFAETMERMGLLRLFRQEALVQSAAAQR